MAEHLHTVTITGDENDTYPRIKFTCSGDRNADCHSYPDCKCEEWIPGHHEHPSVPHDKCWMQDWFVNDAIDPCPDSLSECDLKPGMSGPIKTSFCWDYVEWEFIDA